MILENIELNLEEVEFHTPFTPLEEGVYTCVIGDMLLTKSKEKGIPMVEFVLKPVVENDTFKDRKIKEYILLDKPWALSKLKSFLKAGGVTDFKSLDINKICQDKLLIDKEIQVNIGVRKFVNEHGRTVTNNTIDSIVM